MLYLNNTHISACGTDWRGLVERIRCTAKLLTTNDYSQPVKPYLRYNKPSNRIIAMPAYVGGDHPGAGIKWIASFPDNIRAGISRAHSVIILNDVDSGKPLCTINAASVSSIRTASVSGLMIDEYLSAGNRRQLTAGITGFGPIGKMHLQMLEALFGDRFDQYLVYDLLPERISGIPEPLRQKVRVMDCWQDVYMPADVFITCTVSSERYINLPPPRGSLQLNVSLRDYMPEYVQYVDRMIVDDWKEICRENTDIEQMHLQCGLQPEHTISIGELVSNSKLADADRDQVIMFNPMGMAVFDIATAGWFYKLALAEHTGVYLED